ncbi:polyprotein [Drepanopeziza brunnea f. sp. 'multigermtubi' MB_m1]|uniref:Polyprotein n=1 Tax=Marssonina brunnea f. sp. multigermtubi (strain MB_m1) TaxID=1072389 RepID=K1WMA0_MARBU|nr:polyprotein [Drepanopeziza brunnea f. sp. 'multigermtubi' MB_m1]EKD18825.1 polyprotein [Drepanopeziza brunnea f. sp. 'multigermtubi' MB_m1]
MHPTTRYPLYKKDKIRYTIILATEQNTRTNKIELQSNLVHYFSVKCSRITKSVLASEVYSIIAKVDIAIAISITLAIITKQLGIPIILIIILINSYSFYKCLVKLNTTKEKRLIIDIIALKQSYEKKELTEVRWIAKKHNTADAITKKTPNKALKTFLDTNKLKVKLEGRGAKGLFLESEVRGPARENRGKRVGESESEHTTGTVVHTRTISTLEKGPGKVATNIAMIFKTRCIDRRNRDL